ncbi:hypothetical protein SSPO_087330 [Streptomyces antimycoticus]|uniref:Uncharacterized protein n=1 Tax=Streptomyces antimycoticus TaxID=68175 RepID=A0A499UUZ7_9ACTN|nr:hypothetical protein SSPO_087330 [Streptomyces antimycoticus]
MVFAGVSPAAAVLGELVADERLDERLPGGSGALHPALSRRRGAAKADPTWIIGFAQRGHSRS